MDVEEQLIDCVREERVLYDRTHRKYMDTNLKMRIWRSIATKCGINSGDAAKVLWKKLRDSYRASRKRKPSGSAAPFANRWKYDMQMSFLQPFMRDRTRKIDRAMQEDIAETQETANSVPLQKSVAEESQEHLPSEEGILTATHCSPETKYAITSSSKAQEKGEKNDRREEIRSTLHEKDDPLKSFFDSMYGTTKTFPAHLQRKIKKGIFLMVTEAEEQTEEFVNCSSNSSRMTSRLSVASNSGALRTDTNDPSATKYSDTN